MKFLSFTITFLIATNLWSFSQEDLKKATSNSKPNMVTTTYLEEEGKYVVSIPLRELWLNEDRKEIFELAQKNAKHFAKDYYLKLVEYSEIFLTDKEKQEAAIEELKAISEVDRIPDLKEILRRADTERDSASEILNDNKRAKKLQAELGDISEAFQAAIDELKVEDYDFLDGLKDRALIPSAVILALPQIHFSKEAARRASQHASKLPSILGPIASLTTKLAFTNTSVTPVVLGTAYKVYEYDILTRTTKSYIKQDYEILLMAQKDAVRTKAQDGRKQKTNLRVGFGLITGELKSLQDLNGVFTGASFHMLPSPSRANPAIGNYLLNVKVGTIMPNPLTRFSEYSEPKNYTKNNYIIVSRQFNKRGKISNRRIQSLNWNNGVLTTIKSIGSVIDQIGEATETLSAQNVEELESQGQTVLKDGTKIKVERQ